MYLAVVSKCVYDLTNAWSPFLQRHLNAASQNYMEFDPTLSLLYHQATCVWSLTITLSLKVHSMLLYLLGTCMQYITKTIIVPLPAVGKKGGGAYEGKKSKYIATSEK